MLSEKTSAAIRSGALVLACLVILTGGALVLWPQPDLWGDVSFSTVVMDRHGQTLRVTLSPDEKYRVYTPLAQIPVQMQEATVLYEDRAFWSHPGVNFLAMGRAVFQMLGGGRRMGGSTITMQLARMTGDLDSTRIPGKLRQIWRALILERDYSKTEILEAYFNLAPYGGNIEGVGAAALVWFGKKAEALNLPEILALVPVPQNPASRNPLALQGKALPEARIRLNEIWQHSHPDSDLNLFAQVPLQVRGPAALPREAPHAVNSLLAQSVDYDPRQGPLETSLDLSIQKSLEGVVSRAVSRGRLWGMHNASVLLLDWRSGEIRALVGSADFNNADIQGQVDGTLARRSPGSTLKPFIYALALEQGLIHPLSLLSDTPRVFRGYVPENADSQFRGPISATEALQASRNIPAISLAGQLRNPDLYAFLRAGGVNFLSGPEHYGLSLVLGGAEVSMRELAALYAMLANKGVLHPATLLPSSDAPGRRLLSPEAAYLALDMLRLPSPGGYDRAVSYWKTGTSNGQRDAWTAGIVGPYCLVVWVGNFDGSPNPGFTGLGAAAPLFFEIVQALASRENLPDLLSAEVDDLNLVRIPVCAATGDLNTALCPGPAGQAETWFIPGVSPIRESGILREIIVDTETGLRQCVDIPGQTRRLIWEFWPADLRRQFEQAGISKAPVPDYAPECLDGGQLPGLGPRITSPAPGVTYTRSLANPRAIPLLADAEPDAKVLYWFAGEDFLGSAGPEQPLFWTPTPGRIALRVVDDLGRAGRLTVNIETVP